MTLRQVIDADLLWTGSRFAPDSRLVIDERGMIEAMGPREQVAATPTLRLNEAAVLPGMVNAHSHAFQRGLRGQGETFPRESGTFWTWREAMYGLVARMDEALMYRLSKQAFDEMLAAGITTVGEFHYLHHDASDEGYALDDVVLQAARDSGIRIALLHAYYRTGGINQPLAGGQLRFQTRSIDEYWTQVDALRERLDPARESIGVVAHSIRAAGLDEIGVLHNRAGERGLVFHMHVEEQHQEIAACVEAYGETPMCVLDDELSLDERFTAVHCTHTRPADLDGFVDAGATVCICPLTEANLGDGISDAARVHARGGRICLGTDSNARISMIEEMRWLEYVQRLSEEQRGVFRDDDGRAARALWEMATVNGAHSLGLDTGRIAVGLPADLIAIDLRHRDLTDAQPDTLLESIVFGAGNGVVSGTCVGGRWIIEPPAS